MNVLHSTDPRTTKGITHEQRYYLCLKKQECPSMKQSELAAWFKKTYLFTISQPTISHSLKKSTEILARGISTPGLEPSRVRRRPVRHPELELALFQWVQQQKIQEQEQRQDQRQEGGQDQEQEASENVPDPTSGPILIQQAKKIAQEMNIQDIVFCPGWLSRFKVRYGLAAPRVSNQSDNHCRDYRHNSHHQHSYPYRYQNHQHIEQRSDRQFRPEIDTSQRTVSSITISNHSCSPSPSSDHSMSHGDAFTSGDTLNTSALGTVEIRPSIAVPASFNSSHTSLQSIRPQHTDFNSIHILPSPEGVDHQSLQQHQQQHQDAQLLQQFSMQNYRPSTERITHFHPLNQQTQSQQPQHQQHHHQQDQNQHQYSHQQYPHHHQQHQHHTLTNYQSVTPTPSSLAATSTTELTTAMHLEFLQSIPITSCTNGTEAVLNASSSLPPSPLSHQTSRSFLQPGDPFHSSVTRPSPATTATTTGASVSSMDRLPISGSILEPITAQSKVQTIQEAQRLIHLLRQYAGSNLQDPTAALNSLKTLEWELDPTRMRGSINISELEDDQD